MPFGILHLVALVFGKYNLGALRLRNKWLDLETLGY